MKWDEWFDIQTLKAICRHLSGAVGAIIGYRVLSLAAEWSLKDGTLHKVLKTMDNFVLVGLMIWLAYQLAWLLWKQRLK